ncbi:VOC family protein [Parahaliea sp. F7430]|uniref:VOC family protein n=1 Tax=Sediminihaliea albiluteola TaxID=2758564 RepID=A0A7W2TXE9_9GAMM|nr:VOC family protein [Sediminihaliea albiluteola]MBA6413713.1 VOC family protein [Sediminihaliea albiluteola]
MNDATRAQLGLGPMDQLGFVFKDLEAAVKAYEPIYGPFKIINYGSYDYNYRGQQEACELRMAFARSGDLEIEFIQWVSGGSPHKEFLDAGREGMHHVRFRVESLESKVAEAEKLGYRAIWQTRFAEGLAVAYMERDCDPVLVELFENLQE